MTYELQNFFFLENQQFYRIKKKWFMFFMYFVEKRLVLSIYQLIKKWTALPYFHHKQGML